MDAKSFHKKYSRDAISQLPDEVPGKILSFLPTRQAASTSLLSKQWRNVFRLVDNLDFDDSASGVDNLEKNGFPESFKNFMDKTLALQCDYPIKKFSLKCHVDKKNDYHKACVSRWISNVVERGVLELDLRIRYQAVHSMPPQLFASKTLVKLTLGTRLYLAKLPSYVSLPSLKTLFIDTTFVDDENFCGALLAGCPVLENLSLHHYGTSGASHDISSPTIKRLSIDYEYYDKKEMLLNLPNLVYFDYSYFALAKYPQVNLESLVEAKLDLHLVGRDEWRTDVTNLFFGLRNIEILHLSTVSVDVISRCVKHGLLLPVFNNLVSLSFGSDFLKKGRSKLLAYLLQQSPKLETLIIQDLFGYTCDDVSMPRNKVKVLHILGYQETYEALKQLKSFVGEFECLEVVQVNVVEEDDDDNGRMLQTKKDLKMLLGVSLPSKCHFKVT